MSAAPAMSGVEPAAIECDCMFCGESDVVVIPRRAGLWRGVFLNTQARMQVCKRWQAMSTTPIYSNNSRALELALVNLERLKSEIKPIEQR